MAWTWEQAEARMASTGSFFSLAEGGAAKIRFLYNTTEDIVPIFAHIVDDGSQYGTLVECGVTDNDVPISACKYCSQQNKAVVRCVIPLYNEEAQTIQYWTRTGQFMKQNIIPILQEVSGPISGQVFKIKRQGSGRETSYTILPDTSVPNDGRTREQFGEIKNAVEANCIKEANYNPPVNNNNQGFGNNQNNFNNQGYNNQNFGGQNNGFQNNQGFGNNGGFQSTRRTSTF